VEKIYNAISVFLFCSLSLSLYPLSLLHSSIPFHSLMLRVKVPVTLAHSFEFLLIGSLKTRRVHSNESINMNDFSSWIMHSVKYRLQNALILQKAIANASLT
jgi:hypothetical protein